ncbi:MAG: MBL fold metallo-hydrolase [Deltaproteobacteria bacterium]|nr:MBL fold metallo-hydrolase [Deltaproteobacteria bacterium]
MIDIRQFRYGADNLGYLLSAGTEAMAVDGGDPEGIARHAASAGLTVTLVTNTHSHGDHTSGNRRLLALTGARHVDHRDFARGGRIALGNEEIEVIPAPGHTLDSVVFRAGGSIVTGDTLFNGTIGNCFSGDLPAFYATVRRLRALPDATRVWAGHDYVRDSMAFARRLEPANPHIDAFLAAHDPGRVVSTLGDEKRVNPYLRYDEPPILDLLARAGLPVATDEERWLSLMSIE